MSKRVSELVATTTLDPAYVLPITVNPGAAGGTKKIAISSLLKDGGKILYVDATNGNDTTATKGTALPYLTLAAAKSAASSGDTIIVLPGSYTGNDLLKNGVNWHFSEGTTVTHDLSGLSKMEGTTTVKAIFDDNGSAVTSKITGHGQFILTFGTQRWNDGSAVVYTMNPNRRGFLRLDHASSDVTVEFDTVRYSGYGDTGLPLVYVKKCTRCVLRGNELNTTNATQGYDIAQSPYVNGPNYQPDPYSGITWLEGEFYVDIGIIRTGQTAIYVDGATTTASTNFWLRASLLESWNGPVVNFTGAATDNYKFWATVNEIRAAGTGGGWGSANNALHLQGVGKVHITAQKIGQTGSSGTLGYLSGNSAGTMEVWINAQKLSCGDSSSNRLRVGNGATNTVRCWLECLHFDSTASSSSQTAFIDVNGSGTTLYLEGGTMRMKQNTIGLLHTSGKTFAKNLRIETNEVDDVDNNPAKAVGTGLVLDNCTLIAPALADSIAGNQTVKVYGTSYANKAVNGSVTIQAGLGSLTVDANVT